MDDHEIEQGRPVRDLTRASLAAQGVPRPEIRVSEIAVEAERLITGFAAHVGRLSYYDEPSHFAALLMNEKADG